MMKPQLKTDRHGKNQVEPDFSVVIHILAAEPNLELNQLICTWN